MKQTHYLRSNKLEDLKFKQKRVWLISLWSTHSKIWYRCEFWNVRPLWTSFSLSTLLFFFAVRKSEILTFICECLFGSCAARTASESIKAFDISEAVAASSNSPTQNELPHSISKDFEPGNRHDNGRNTAIYVNKPFNLDWRVVCLYSLLIVNIIIFKDYISLQ